MVHVAVLFLHGLNMPTQASSTNRHFTACLERIVRELDKRSGTNTQLTIHTVNYAQLHAPKQQQMWNQLKFPLLNWTTPLRLLPMRYLNLGLSFWGDDEVHKATIDHISEALGQLAAKVLAKSDNDEVRLVLVGFSMGATLAIEYLTQYEAVFDEDAMAANLDLSHETRWLLRKFAHLVTVGCAVNWHHPIRPFSRHVDMPWINVHYDTDVLASRISNQGEEVSHVEDFGVSIAPMLPGEEISETAYNVREGRSWLYALWLWYAAFLFHPLATLKCALIFLARLTPLSHFYYFYDTEIMTLIAKHVVRATRHDCSPTAGRFRARTASQPPRTHSDAVRLELVESEDYGQNPDKELVFVYVPGMSTVDLINQEIENVRIGISREMEQVFVSAQKPFAYKIYMLTYYHLMQKDESIRTGRLYEAVIAPPKRRLSVARVTQSIRDHVLRRFPIALSYWSEKDVRKSVHDSFHEAVEFLRAELSLEARANTNVVFITYTIGSIVSALALGELQQNLNSNSAVDIFQTKEDENRIKFSSFISLGSPLPWFGTSRGTPFPCWPSLTRAQKEALFGWTNIFYSKDIHAVSLRKAGYSQFVNKEVEFGKFKRTQYHKDSGGIISLAFNATSWILPVNEVLASWNGQYLQDAQFWQIIQDLARMQTR